MDGWMGSLNGLTIRAPNGAKKLKNPNLIQPKGLSSGERSKKRQQPFSASLPAKGETLAHLSRWDLSNVKCDCFKVSYS